MANGKGWLMCSHLGNKQCISLTISTVCRTRCMFTCVVGCSAPTGLFAPAYPTL